MVSGSGSSNLVSTIQTYKHLIKITVGSISLIHIRITDQIYFEKILNKVKEIVKCYSMLSIGTKFPDSYIYEKQLYLLSFFYQKLGLSTVEIGIGLFSHVINIYKNLKEEITSDEAFIDLTIYEKNKKIIGYSDKLNLKKKINIVKDLTIEVN